MKTVKANLFPRVSTGRHNQALVSVLLLSLVAAQSGRCQVPAIPDDVKASIMMRVTNGFTPAIVVGVVNSNGSSFFSCGVRDLDTGEPVNEDSIFEIGSITKTFTGTVLSQLVMDGALLLTNPVQAYLPEGIHVPSRNGKVITLKHLATHYSGLPNMPTNHHPTNALNPYADYTVEQMYDFLSSYQLPRDPGATYEYSNFGMGLVGHVLELKTGSDYETLITQRITGPLGMTNTAVRLSPRMAGNLVRGYNGLVPTPNWDFTSAFAGAGSLRASARDLLRYVAANMGLVPTVLYPAMTNAHTPLNMADPNTATSIGLAWLTTSIQGDQATWHSGMTDGYSTFVGFLQSKKLGVVVLTSCGFYSVDDIGAHLLDSTVPLATVPTPVAVDLETLHSCVGRYQSGAARYFDIGLLHGYLTIAASWENGLTYSLYPSSRYSFFVTGVEGTAVFHTNSLGLVTSLNWSQNGHSTFYNRVALPSHLAIQRVNGETRIGFTGDTDVNYVLETSTDLAYWQPISTNTIWTQPIVDSEYGVSRFYRLRRP